MNMHTDSAKSYKATVPGVLHDRVIHKKQRIKVGTKFRWIAPKYVEMKCHKVPGSKKIIKTKSGTQMIDRCWRYLKERLNINQNCRVGSRMLKMKLRSAQYGYWCRGQDLWISTGQLIQWFMSSTVQAAWGGGCCMKSKKMLHAFAIDVLAQIVILHVVTASVSQWATFLSTSTKKNHIWVFDIIHSYLKLTLWLCSTNMWTSWASLWTTHISHCQVELQHVSQPSAGKSETWTWGGG